MGQLKVASVLGLAGQVLIWGSAIALWVFGSLFSNIPVQTTLAYGAHALSIPSAVIFALNYALIVGAFIALLSFLLYGRGFQSVGTSRPRNERGGVFGLAVIGGAGFGVFAVGWLIWLGSFVAPGTSPSSISDAYTPVLAPNLSLFVDLLLVWGGALAFVGMVGNAVGNSRVGTTYEEGTVELGGVLLVLPLFSVIGYALSLVGFRRGERKVAGGWSPPPPPPPAPPAVVYVPAYPGTTPVMAPRPTEGGDGLVVALMVFLVLVWLIILPISVAFLTGGFVYGPSGSSGGGGTVPSASSSPGGNLGVLLPLVGLAITAVLLPIIVVRNRRKRQRAVSAAPARPPPPPPPPPPAREEDHLDHLV